MSETPTKLLNQIKNLVTNYSNNKTELKKQAINHSYEIHGELNWRQKVYNLEIQYTYTVMDLIILNSLINPYDHGDILDNYINCVITNIISEILKTNKSSKRINEESLRYKAICDVNTKPNEKSAEIGTTPTLFDFPINEKILNKPLNPKQSAQIRECAHLLLKNDWKKQVK